MPRDASASVSLDTYNVSAASYVRPSVDAAAAEHDPRARRDGEGVQGHVGGDERAGVVGEGRARRRARREAAGAELRQSVVAEGEAHGQELRREDLDADDVEGARGRAERRDDAQTHEFDACSQTIACSLASRC